MDNIEKAKLYQMLMSEFNRLNNQIAAIKGEDINLNEEQLRRISVLQHKQSQIKSQIMSLF